MEGQAHITSNASVLAGGLRARDGPFSILRRLALLSSRASLRSSSSCDVAVPRLGLTASGTCTWREH